MRDLDYWGTTDWEIQHRLMEAIHRSLRDSGKQNGWSLSYGEPDATSGLAVMRLPTVSLGQEGRAVDVLPRLKPGDSKA